jgi:hypothetical protein
MSPPQGLDLLRHVPVQVHLGHHQVGWRGGLIMSSQGIEEETMLRGEGVGMEHEDLVRIRHPLFQGVPEHWHGTRQPFHLSQSCPEKAEQER